MDSEADLTRLAELQRVLGTALPEIVAKLVSEITAAIAEIDAGVSNGDLTATARAAHAARNSALMLDAQPVLGALAEIEDSARASNYEGTRTGLARLRSSWPPLREQLERVVGAG